MTSLYRLALLSFPAGHRAVYGAEMVEAFEYLFAVRRREGGSIAALRFVIVACLDAVRAGSNERRRHQMRDTRHARGSPLGSLGRDLAHAVRALSKSRGFTFVSVASLGIGLGAVLTMLLFLRLAIGTPPGFSTGGLTELVVLPQESLRAQVNDWAIDTWSYPDFEELRSTDTGMTLTGWTPDAATLRAPGGAAARVDAMYVTPNYFDVLGVALTRGGGFTTTAGAAREVVLAHRVWRNRFNSDPSIVGRPLVINGESHIVVGVTPEGFRGHLAQHRPGFQIWLPLAHHPRLSGSDSVRFNRRVDWVQLLGRLHDGRTRVEASAIVSSIMQGIGERHPETNTLKLASVEPYYAVGARRRVDMVGESMTFVIGASLVLLVVCVNLSGMVAVRSASRERELAVRLAIGASRRRLMQYLLAESVVLALLGGALGVAVIFGIPTALALWAGAEMDDFGQMTLDATAVAMGVGICLLAALIFGLLPALRFSRPTVMRALKDDAGGGGRRVGRVHRWGVAVQAGLAVPFLVVGGVQLDQFRVTAAADLGFTPAGLFAAPLDLAGATRGAGDAPFVLRTVQANLEQASGVTSVGLADGLPLDERWRQTAVSRDGVVVPVRAHTTRISPGYLETLGVRLVRGRDILEADRSGSELVVLISQALAARLFPEGDPVGQRLTFGIDQGHLAYDARWFHQSVPSEPQPYTVVGVTADVVDGYMGPPKPQIFVPLAQHPAGRVMVVARSDASQQAMAEAFERAVTGLYPDPDIIGANLITGERLVRSGRSELIFGSVMAAIAASAALLLAALGIFGVVGFMVATRTREIGIRIALGASRSRVLRDVLTDSVKLAVWGVAGGLALAFIWAREVSWTEVGGVETAIYALAALIALGVALIAGLPAARRAAAVEPIVAMRAE